MKTDTPETKAFMQSLQGYCDSYEVFAQKVEDFTAKLERERNAAREALSGRTVSCSQCNELANKLAANEAYQMGLIAERDEAREALENHLALTIHSCSPYCQRPLCVANRQIAEMHKAIKEAEALLVAVDNGAQQDIHGVNWYDRRKLALAKLQPHLKP